MDRRKLIVVATAAAALVVPSVAQAADRDHDGLPDRWEKRHHLSVRADSSGRDPDRDRVDNANEFREGSNPRDADTDNDGRRDGREDGDHDRLNNAGEDMTGNDPTDRDTDGDGIPDGREQAGVVTSIEDGVVTIDLVNGGSVSARVTEDTEVECATEDEAQNEQEDTPEDETSDDDTAQASHDGDRSGEGDDETDNSGPGSDNSGPGRDHGGCDGFDGEGHDDCPAGTLAVGAIVHEALIRETSDGAVLVEIEILT